MRKLILKNLSEVGVDLQDMSATVDIATRDPTKFGLDTRELNRRSVFVLSSQRQVEEIRAEISESDGMNTPTKQRERRGLLSADSPGVPKRGSGGSRGQQEMQASNDHVVEMEHMKQQQAKAFFCFFSLFCLFSFFRRDGAHEAAAGKSLTSSLCSPVVTGAFVCAHCASWPMYHAVFSRQFDEQEVQQQDQQLRGLSGVMDRLGEMGRQINTELKAQG